LVEIRILDKLRIWVCAVSFLLQGNLIT
jgi:hypothetical protein